MQSRDKTDPPDPYRIKILSESGISILAIVAFEQRTSLRLPYFATRIPAGFPSPADDYVEDRLDLNELVIKRPASTFFVHAVGNSMRNAGIHDEDILIVDRGEEAVDRRIVVAVVNGEFTVKRVQRVKGKLFLLPENDAFPPIEITKEMDFEVWGVVICVLHRLV